MPPVHPRVCGEHTIGARDLTASAGSSPRVRGTLVRHDRVRVGLRFIPACAGNTNTGVRSAGAVPVHPRVCGEHLPQFLHDPEAVGSSPRVRGTHEALGHVAVVRRFIPACAGNTTRSKPPTPPSPVHPRVCGEHGHRVVHIALDDGSSPRVRGTRLRQPLGQRLGRFIPACAGNTSSTNTSVLPDAVHPRVCGEHLFLRQDPDRAAGSSPRVRGTRRGDPAGKVFGPVHPRVCGEHPLSQSTRQYGAGSSPRVRGTPEAGRLRAVYDRFIPACAGNTLTHRKTA